MITDHYFHAKLVDSQSVSLTPPGRFRTLQGAMLFADEQDVEVSGTVFYVEDPALPAQPVLRFVDGVAEVIG